MELRKFRRAIRQTKKDLTKQGYCTTYYDGVCVALSDSDLYTNGAYFFKKTFSPSKDEERGVYWLGERNKKNLPLRKFFLSAFESYCIEFDLYKEF